MQNDNLRENLLLGMGNPLLDISANVDKELLAKYDLKADNAILAADKHKDLFNELVNDYEVEYIAGGSVLNTLRVAQWIIQKPNVTTFFGCVSDDKYAKILKERAVKNGVNVQFQYNSNKPTGRCAVLVTESVHRSLCADLGAAEEFTIDHIKKPENKKLIESASFYYVSGFFLTVCPPAVLEVAKHALSKDRPFIMNLSAVFISQHFKDQLMQVMPYVDILFGNESEAEAFATEQGFATKDLKEIALKICKLPKQNENRSRICIITHGCEPVILAQDGEISEFPVTKLPKEKIVDTNGAGDAFVGGFLGQYVQDQPLDVCIRCGIWTSSTIIQRSGCTFTGKADFKP